MITVEKEIMYFLCGLIPLSDFGCVVNKTNNFF